MFAFTWQSLQNVVAKPVLCADAVGHPGFAAPFLIMKETAEPWGPWAAGEAASVLWQSPQDIVCVPRLTFQGATIWAAARAFGATLPAKLLSEARTGWPDLLFGLNSIA